MQFYMPVQLFVEDNALQKHGRRLAALGSKCMVVTGAAAAKRSGALEDVTRVLTDHGIPYSVFDRIAPNPTMESCLQAAAEARSFGADFIIGIGGGSALDAAKVIALAAANPQADGAAIYAKQWTAPRLPVAVIGTTAGTGSEVTPVAVLTNHKGVKKSIRDDMLFADLALGDPKYTATLPRSVTVSTGIDAVTHCVESYFSKKADSVSRAFSLMGLELLLPCLEDIDRGETPSLSHRDALYKGSVLAGLAISITGTVFAHNVGYYFSEEHGLPHGEACALFLPELLDHAESCAPAYTQQFFQKLGTNKQALSSLTRRLLPLPAITLTEECIDGLLPRWENNGSVNNTIGTITTAYIKQLLLQKFG